MKCPTCDEILVMTMREGVEIDYCPKCRGIWLDRGELDKIIEKTVSGQHANHAEYDNGDYKDDHHYNDHNDPNYKRKKKRGFLSDLFEFD